MKCYVGIDLGSTTTKAVILDEGRRIAGRGITNSRSNYDLAAAVARSEAFINARFTLLERRCADLEDHAGIFLHLENAFRLQQYREQLEHLERHLRAAIADGRHQTDAALLGDFTDIFLGEAEAYGRELYLGESRPSSDFFRDLAGITYNRAARDFSRGRSCSLDLLLGLFDKSIIKVENERMEHGFADNIRAALAELHPAGPLGERLAAEVEEICALELEDACTVGTGYGRQRLPFPREQIRSEILCHGLGAHAMFPATATVLDIGGQDTKAIQVDAQGIVSSFQMNDRCAAGCGRYLGYIAEEMNLSLPELGPMAMSAGKAVKINSTCTVFAGAELRDRLSDGQKREDILLGLHKAIMYRAMSLLARSGGVRNEFTFTGGVAKNEAATTALRELVAENYGPQVVINIAPDSIYTGALGAAIFAHREAHHEPVEAAA
jgi:benzoyl-CoA reductase subunit A